MPDEHAEALVADLTALKDVGLLVAARARPTSPAEREVAAAEPRAARSRPPGHRGGDLRLPGRPRHRHRGARPPTVREAPMAGGLLFEARAVLEAPPETSTDVAEGPAGRPRRRADGRDLAVGELNPATRRSPDRSGQELVEQARLGAYARSRGRRRRGRRGPGRTGGRRPWWRPGRSGPPGAGTRSPAGSSRSPTGWPGPHGGRSRLPDRATRCPSTTACPRARTRSAARTTPTARAASGDQPPATASGSTPRRSAATAIADAGTSARVHRRRTARGPCVSERGRDRSVLAEHRGRDPVDLGAGRRRDQHGAALLLAAQAGDDRRQPCAAGEPEAERLTDADARRRGRRRGWSRGW